MGLAIWILDFRGFITRSHLVTVTICQGTHGSVSVLHTKAVSVWLCIVYCSSDYGHTPRNGLCTEPRNKGVLLCFSLLKAFNHLIYSTEFFTELMYYAALHFNSKIKISAVYQRIV